MLHQDVNCLCIGHTGKVIIHYIMESLDQSLVYKVIEKLHLGRRVLEHVVYDVLEHALGELHVILKICKSYLRLDHPELCGMSCRI